MVNHDNLVTCIDPVTEGNHMGKQIQINTIILEMT